MHRASDICCLHDADLFTLPTPQTESINACGQNVRISTYSIGANDFGKAIYVISRDKGILRFAIRVGHGTAKLSESISLTRKAKVVLLGHSLVNTTIDFQSQSQIHMIDSNVCIQDLTLTNGQVLHTQPSCSKAFRAVYSKYRSGG